MKHRATKLPMVVAEVQTGGGEGDDMDPDNETEPAIAADDVHQVEVPSACPGWRQPFENFAACGFRNGRPYTDSDREGAQFPSWCPLRSSVQIVRLKGSHGKRTT